MEQPLASHWEFREGIGLLTLGEIPGNYLADPEFVPLEILKEWTSLPELKAVVVTGTGRHFSAGADASALFRMALQDERLEERLQAGHAVIRYLRSLDIPLLAAIRGTCFGGGLEIALACDICIASENALFAFPESNLGLMPGLGGTWRLPYRTGFPEALAIILGGDLLNAREAKDLKLVDQVVSRDDLLPTAFRLLKKMTNDRPLPVIRSIVRVLRNAGRLSEEEALREETRAFCQLAAAEARRRQLEENPEAL